MQQTISQPPFMTQLKPMTQAVAEFPLTGGYKLMFSDTSEKSNSHLHALQGEHRVFPPLCLWL